MIEPNLGTRGATRQSWGRTSIRTIIKEAQEAHPRANNDRLETILMEQARDDEDVLRAFIRYGIDNTMAAQESYRKTRHTPTRQERVEQEAEITKVAKAAAAQILLLNLEMPNGKRMRYCTREEMQKFNGGYSRLIKKMKPGQMVGQAFSEKEVRALMI